MRVITSITLLLVFVFVSPFAMAQTQDAMTCREAIINLGFDDQPYSFEQGGILTTDLHRFGDITCSVGDDGVISELSLGLLTLGQDGIIGPEKLVLKEAIAASHEITVDNAREQRKRAIERAQIAFDEARTAAYEAEESRIFDYEKLKNQALDGLQGDGVPPELVRRLGVNPDDVRFQPMTPAKMIEASRRLKEENPTIEERMIALYSKAGSLAAEAYNDPEKFASDMKSQGVAVLESTKIGARTYANIAIEKTGEAFDLLSGADVCESIEIINATALDYAGGFASGAAAMAKTAKPGHAIMYIQRTYDELTVVRGVGYIRKSVTGVFITSKVVPAIPTTLTGAATATAVVYLGASGVCYVTSPEAKDDLEAATDFTFTLVGSAMDEVQKMFRYLTE